MGFSSVVAAAARSRSSSFLPTSSSKGNRVFEFFENGILNHLGVDHVLELKLVEREDGDHLNQARGQDLALRKLDAQFVLQ